MFSICLNFIIAIAVYFYLVTIYKKKKILKSQTGESHQYFSAKENVPLIGGIVLLIFFIYFYKKINFDIFFLLIPIFTLGISSDIKIIRSPSIRFIIQIIIVLFTINYFGLTIHDLKVDIINSLLLNKYFLIFFSLFCILTLINGSNFIDGMNSLVLIYYLIVFNFLINLDLLSFLNFTIYEVMYFNFFFLLIILLNFSNKLYLGDSGVYVLVIFFSFLVIKSYKNNYAISPYFYALILWYPAFENLFSIIRKLFNHKKPSHPDNLHLHHLVFQYFKLKFNKSDLFCNNLSSITINCFNFFIFFLGSKYIFYTKYLVSLIIAFIFLYLLIYFILLHKKIRISC